MTKNKTEKNKHIYASVVRASKPARHSIQKEIFGLSVAEDNS